MQNDAFLARLEREAGVVFPYPMTMDRNAAMAMDAQPALATSANAGIPTMLTTFIDPDVLEVMVSPMRAAVILGEAKKGDWTQQTAMFPVVERTGFVSSYDDFSQDGVAGSNTQFPQRQAYRYQTNLIYGDLEVEKMGLTRINWIAQLQKAAALTLRKFENQVYLKGVAGLQNYGLLNDPALSAPISPGTKVAGNGNVWIYNGALNNAADANFALEVFTDIQNMWIQLVKQTGGIVNAMTSITLAMHPTSALALTATNSYNVNVYDLLKKNFPNIRFEVAVEYSTAAGYLVQMIAPEVEGQRTGYAAFAEKMRSHRIIAKASSFEQKKSGSVWGSVLRQPYNIVGLLGV